MPDFNQFLHDLRTVQLRTMPPGARTFLSAGCAGSWYFKWIADNYPGLEQHVGVEAFSPKPTDLPLNATWIANTVGDMREVQSGSVDLLFSGQNIEHLQATDVTAFLCEAKRVLRPGGWLVMDSPNRAITDKIGWVQPEHIIEFRVDEIAELVRLAGFDIDSIRGLWQCYDPVSHTILSLEPSADGGSTDRRINQAQDDPENAFVWWITAKSGKHESDRPAVGSLVEKIASKVFPQLTGRFLSQVGSIKHGPLMGLAEVERGVAGYVIYGPYMPLFPGHYRAEFRLRAKGNAGLYAKAVNAPIARIDAGSFGKNIEFASQEIGMQDIATPELDGFSRCYLDFTLADAAFGTEFRLYSTGVVGLEAVVPVVLTRVA